jgi:nucleoid-associated protein YgaU
MKRYARAPVIGLGYRYGTSFAIPAIRQNIKAGNIRYQQIVLQESNRLDILAGQFYGDGKLWWLIAAASDIGWGLQVPVGTIIKIPDLKDVSKFVG